MRTNHPANLALSFFAIASGTVALALALTTTGCSAAADEGVDTSEDESKKEADPVLVESDDDDIDVASDAVDGSDDPTEEDDLDDEDAEALVSGVKTYVNPVKPNCADPGVIKLESGASASFLTACTGNDFPVFSSPNLVDWKKAGDGHLLAKAPKWSNGKPWAPEVHQIGAGYVAYYSFNDKKRNRPCLGAATSNSPEGPFTDIGRPLLCDSKVGLIDVHEMNAGDDPNGAHFLYYKSTTDVQPTVIYGRRLGADGLSFPAKKERHRLIRNNLGWEHLSVEGPWTMQRGKYTYLFYSGGAYCNDTYAVGVARATSPLGPFTKKGAPILTGNGKWTGPGHNSITALGGKTYIVYHAWPGAHTCNDAGDRDLLLDRVSWSGGWPHVADGHPSTKAKPVPHP